MIRVTQPEYFNASASRHHLSADVLQHPTDLPGAFGGAGGTVGGVDGGAGGAGGAGDPCAVNNCDTHATCTVDNGQAVCTCDWPYYGVGTACTAPSDQNWDFEDWSTYSDPPVDFVKNPETDFSLTEETSTVNDGSAACNVTWSTTSNRDMLGAMYGTATGGTEYTTHLWIYDNDPAGRGRMFLWFYDAAGDPLTSGAQNYGGYSNDAAGWRNLTHTVTSDSSAAFVRGGARFYDVGSGFTTATVYVDDFDLTAHESFDVTDAALDTLAGVPAAPWQITASPLPIYFSMNDEGVVYMATSHATAGQGDRMVFAWFGTPDPTNKVPMPWSKAGTVAAPNASGFAVVLIQEESDGYCEMRYILPGGTSWDVLTIGECSSQVAGQLVEGSVDLPAVLGGVPMTSLPAYIHTAAIEIGGANGGTLDQGLQTPACVTCNTTIEDNETIATHRARVLVGRVSP